MPTKQDAFATKIARSTLQYCAKNYLALLLLALFAWIILATAWLSDDSLISLRQAWNAAHGHGFTWNFNQRVQAFTHPTWMLLLTAVIAVTRELYFPAVVLSIAFSLAAIYWIIAHHNLLRARALSSRNSRVLLAVLLALAFSKSFTDYTSSGLENPLSYFLIGWAIYLAAKLERNNYRQLTTVFVLLALLFLNRFDYALLMLPLASWLFFGKARLGVSIKAALPAIVIVLTWFAFALVYFGAPLPNTFYAKLGAGIPTAQLHANAFNYFRMTFDIDPVTILVGLCGIVGGLLTRQRLYQMLSLGVILYCAYIVKIGGDFMLGRFFAVPLYVCIFNLTALFCGLRINFALNKIVLALGCVIGLTALQQEFSPITNYFQEEKWQRANDITTEREFYCASPERRYCLLAKNRNWPKAPPPVNTKPTNYKTGCPWTGEHGITAPDRYWIDRCALTDAFIARLPAAATKHAIGHYGRNVPQGYGDYLTVGKPIADEKLRPLLDDVTQAVSGKLFTRERMRAIYRLNISRAYPSTH